MATLASTSQEFINQIRRQIHLPRYEGVEFQPVKNNHNQTGYETTVDDYVYRIFYDDNMHQFEIIQIQDEASQTINFVEVMPNIKPYNQGTAIQIGQVLLEDIKTNLYPKFYREGQFGFKLASIEWITNPDSTEIMELDIQNFTEKGVFYCTTIYQFNLDTEVAKLCLILLAINNNSKHCDLCNVKTGNSTIPNKFIKEGNHDGLIDELKQKINQQINTGSYNLDMLYIALK